MFQTRSVDRLVRLGWVRLRKMGNSFVIASSSSPSFGLSAGKHSVCVQSSLSLLTASKQGSNQPASSGLVWAERGAKCCANFKKRFFGKHLVVQDFLFVGLIFLLLQFGFSGWHRTESFPPASGDRVIDPGRRSLLLESRSL